MSMHYSSQSDPWKWGEDNADVDVQSSDWNSWPSKPTPVTQSFRPPLDQHQHHPQQKKLLVNKSASDYFDTVHLPNAQPSQDYHWNHNPYQHQSNVGHFPPNNYNNNNSLAEVENKEVAPPDNKYPRNPSPKNNHGMPFSSDVRSHFMPPTLSSKPFISQQQTSPPNSMPFPTSSFEPNNSFSFPHNSTMKDQNQQPPIRPPPVHYSSFQQLNSYQGYQSMPASLPNIQQSTEPHIPVPDVKNILQPLHQPHNSSPIPHHPEEGDNFLLRHNTHEIHNKVPQNLTIEQSFQRSSISPPKIPLVNTQLPLENAVSSVLPSSNLYPTPQVDAQPSQHNLNSLSTDLTSSSGSSQSNRSHSTSSLNNDNNQIQITTSSSGSSSQTIQCEIESNEQNKVLSSKPNYGNKIPPGSSSGTQSVSISSESSALHVPNNNIHTVENPPIDQIQSPQMHHYQRQNPKGGYNVVHNNNIFPMAASSPLNSNHIPENLERLPEDRDIEPDELHYLMNTLSVDPEVERNTKVHCSVDRNQYLETGHLSIPKENVLNENPSNIEQTDEGDAPPPGLDRLVTGQVCEAHSMSIDHTMQLSSLQMEPLMGNDSTRQSSPLSSIVEHEVRQRHSATEGESEGGTRRSGRLVQGQSIGDETDGVREVPGEADPVQSRVVLGQMGGVMTPPIQDPPTSRSDSLRDRDRDIVRRMVVGERLERDQLQSGNLSDEYRQHRTRHRHRRGDSSFDEEEIDYTSDRDRRKEEFKRLGDRNRRRREHRSPEYRSDEEYEDRRAYRRSGRSERRPRDYSSPDRDYRDYREYRDDHRRYRRYEHHNRDYDDDYYRERSRPSSRTGSDYRRSVMDYSMRSQPRQYYQDHSESHIKNDFRDMSGSGYLDTNKFNAYDYYEKMRQTDPVRYAAWYEQYMRERYNSMQHSAIYNNNTQTSTSAQRHNISTPQTVQERVTRTAEEEYELQLFSTHHIKGKLDDRGRLLVIDPNYPLEGQKATIHLYKMSPPILVSDIEEFFESPSPFIPGVTHRNTVLQYLKKISDKATRSSEKLLYDLIHLTVKGNGEVNEVDVAELLMNSYKKSEREVKEKSEESKVEKLSDREVIAKFRELLQQGNKTEALDWAIDNGAWGHALFLASKMDDRTHNRIMVRFANSIPHNDPLQTLYQLMSGNIPESSTCCADKKWSDWRPHLAMILGNPTRDPLLDRKAIIRLGDSLNAHGRLHASHFCYMTAQVEFSHYKPEAKLVLLGSCPKQNFSKFATCRAIMLTMCYEYGLKLRQRDFTISTLQHYKLILALRLIDHGKSKNALQYCEMLANEALQTGQSEKSLISNVIDISSKLKMLDPTLALSGDTDTDPEWLSKLKHYFNELPENHDAGLRISHGISSSTISEVGQDCQPSQVEPVIEAQDILNPYSDPITSYSSATERNLNQVLPPQPILTQPPLLERSNEEQVYHPSFMMNPPMQQNYQPEPQSVETAPPSENYWENSNVEATPAVNNSNNFFRTSEEQLKDVADAKPSIQALNEVARDTKIKHPKAAESKPSKNEEQRSGWFGGIWDKLSMRPKNQMRLPDDSNPSIVWDQQQNRWVNLEGESKVTDAVSPPPRAADISERANPLTNSLPSVPNLGGPNQLGPNKYKLQKGKMMKSNYVDIMMKESKDIKNKTGNQPIHPPIHPSMNVAPVNNYFIPQPVEGKDNAPIDFITPAAPLNPPSRDSAPDANNKQLSRCSSVSSLSREVQYYMSPPSAHSTRPPVQQVTAPMMYDTTRFPS